MIFVSYADPLTNMLLKTKLSNPCKNILFLKSPGLIIKKTLLKIKIVLSLKIYFKKVHVLLALEKIFHKNTRWLIFEKSFKIPTTIFVFAIYSLKNSRLMVCGFLKKFDDPLALYKYSLKIHGWWSFGPLQIFFKISQLFGP